MGGGVAAAFVSKFPHLVDKLCVMCPAGLMDVRILKLIEGILPSPSDGTSSP